MGGRVSESEAPHFFKIVLSDSVQNGRLGIPKKFVRKHGSNLSDSVFLKLANGDAWAVELLRENGGVWLRRNWPDFAKRYSIEHGHFLVFRYEGDSVFRVVIFDKSATEIDYPAISENGGGSKHLLSPKVEAEDEGDVVSVEEGFDDMPSSPALSPLSKKKKKKTSSQASGDEHANEEALNGVGGSSGFPSVCRDRSQDKIGGRSKEEELGAKGGGISSCANNSCIESGFWRRVQPLTGCNKGREVLERAASFRSTNPFFLVLMKPSFLHPRFNLNVPGRFFISHVPNVNRKFDVHLYGSNGGMWHGGCCFGMYNGKAKARIHRGWKEFARDNALRFGDVCAFELVKTDKVSFRIVVFRADIDACRRPRGKRDEDEVAARTPPGNTMTGSEGDGSRKRKQEESMSLQKQTPKKEKPVEGPPSKKTKATTKEEPKLISDAHKDEPAIRPVTSTLDELNVQDTAIDKFVIKVKDLPKAFRHGLFWAKQMIQSLSRFDPQPLI